MSTYRVMIEGVICVKDQKSNEQIRKPGLRKEQEWLELVTELSRELPSLKNKVPFDMGEIMCRFTDEAPALSPKIVILFGSPPNCRIFSLIHFNASC